MLTTFQMVIKDPGKLKPLYRFLNKINKRRPRNLQPKAVKSVENIWDGIDCLSCANCCKSMTPTYTTVDIKRIAGHLNMSTGEMKHRWLKKERGTNNWLNKTTPCQFLDLKTNLCSIYEVRPADCANFPHLNKKRFSDYIHIHKQNIDECPATFKMIERMIELVDQDQKTEDQA